MDLPPNSSNEDCASTSSNYLGSYSLLESPHMKSEKSGGATVLGPLTFPKKVAKVMHDPESDADDPVSCFLCEEEYRLQSQRDAFLKHIFEKHHLVIADVHLVVSLKSYVDFWRVRFHSGPIEEFCSTLLMDTLPDGTPSPDERYFLLSDVLPEDRLLRQGLQEKRLRWVLARQQWEREDNNFSQGCLFCKSQLTGTRAEVLNHLSAKHGLQLGRPDNLVFIDELLTRLQERLEALRCLFCNNLFPDRPTLKEHMRKKQHKGIDPENAEYDRFYIVNYLELGKSWREVEKERDIPTTEGEEETWSDWGGDDEGEEALVCLFCEHQSATLEALNCHSVVQHGGFSLATLGLSFYLQVKLVNYIRRQVHLSCCPFCEKEFTNRPVLLKHMEEQEHFTLPDQALFDQPQYYFPTYEDDSVLCHLQDADNDDAPGEDCSVQS